MRHYKVQVGWQKLHNFLNDPLADTLIVQKLFVVHYKPITLLAIKQYK